MTTDINQLSIQERFQHLLAVLSGERFLNKQGLGNEVPFFICPYRPEEAVDMERLQRQLINNLEQQGIPVLNINLYDLAMELLKREDDFEWLIENETSMSKQKLLEELQGVLDIETIMVPEIADIISRSEFRIMFLSGIGEVFPYIRSHNVLNNLQRVAKEQPTLMFFPGAYTHSLESGASLDLFGKLHDDKYYRAFNIYHCEA